MSKNQPRASKLEDTGVNIFSKMSRLAHQEEAINLSQGFPDFESSPLLQELVYQHMKAGHNQYAPMPGLALLRERLCDKVAALYHQNYNPDTEITITAGATQAIFTAITALIHPGDEVILLEPAYDCYAPSIKLSGGICRSFALRSPDYRPDWSAIAALITPKTRMIIINSPHNPTGSILCKEDFQRLIELTKDSDILILSDEVYEHIVFDGAAHESILGYPELRKRALAVFSFGKTFHNTGWKMGYCIAHPNLMKEFRKVHQFNVFSVNTPMQHALADFLKDEAHYLEIPDFYQEKRDFFAQAMLPSRFKALACKGTYFQLYDYSAISDLKDTDFAEWLTKEHKVATIPISVFYTDGYDAKVVRFCFAKEKATLLAAAQRLCQI